MIKDEDRKKFWEQLQKTRDYTQKTIQDLCSVLPHPQKLCRFRPVSESTLKQLQENKLFYSSADYYDDPFDSFIHIDFEGIMDLYDSVKDALEKEDPKLLGWINQLSLFLGMNKCSIIDYLKEHSLDMPHLKENLKYIRDIVKKNLFSICFCEEELNETLWLKYANNYKGFVLVYDMNDVNTYICGKEEICKNCTSFIYKPTAYPVYYSKESYNATRYALACLLWAGNSSGEFMLPPQVLDMIKNAVMWEAERISLIKKDCHKTDEEWRLIRPNMAPERSFIKMKPQKIVLGLKMPEYERRLVISAAKVAGIEKIEELYINDLDQLATREIMHQ